MLSVCLVGQFTSYVIALFISFIAGILVSVPILIYQFYHSFAAYRLERIIEATKAIVNAANNHEDVSPLRNKYRYSLGVEFDNLAHSFGTNILPRNGDKLPNFIHERNDKNEIIPEDGWKDFNDRIKPVMDEMTPHSFITIFITWPFYGRLCLRRIRRFKYFLNLAYCMVDVIAELDGFRLICIKADMDKKLVFNGMNIKWSEVLKTDNGSLHLNYDFDILMPHKEILLQKYNDLEKAWKKWLREIDLSK